MTWDDLAALPTRAPDRTIAYGADPLQVVDLWLPEGAGLHPVVLMLHGGCWKADIADRTIMNHVAHDLRERGIAVWNVEYRGVDRAGGGYPGTYQDVAAAADLLAAKGAEFRLKIDRMVTIGHSAGGHLALWLADRPALPESSAIRGANPARIDTAISLGGLPDLEFSSNTVGHGCGTDGARAMAGSPPRYAETSPIAMTASTAMRVQVNGEKDRIAPPNYAAAYARAHYERGAGGAVLVVPGSGHVELIAPGTEAWEQTVEMIEEALES